MLVFCLIWRNLIFLLIMFCCVKVKIFLLFLLFIILLFGIFFFVYFNFMELKLIFGLLKFRLFIVIIFFLLDIIFKVLFIFLRGGLLLRMVIRIWNFLLYFFIFVGNVVVDVKIGEVIKVKLFLLFFELLCL